MRGVSNVISAIFVLAAILVAAYAIMGAYIQHTAKISMAAEEQIERHVHAAHVLYSAAECNSQSGALTIQYLGSQPEYALRIVCYDESNAAGTLCVVPFTYTGERSAQYVDYEFPSELELNLAKCNPDLRNTCFAQKLRCVAIGTYAALPLRVTRVA